MRIALIRREYITHLDGVNRFIALLAEGLAKLGHDPLIMTWCYNGIAKDQLPDWFAKMHGLSTTIPIYTLQTGPCQGDPWLKITWDWWWSGFKLLHRKGADAVIVNGVVPLKFGPKIAVNHGVDTLRAARPYLYAARPLYWTLVERYCGRRLDVRGADCAVFTEVIEHLHYYVPWVLSEINKSLKLGGYLILTRRTWPPSSGGSGSPSAGSQYTDTT